MSMVMPRPWKFAGSGIITNDQGDEIALNSLFDEPDALHLIKCVNMHEELLEVIREVRMSHDLVFSPQDLRELAIKMDAVLAKAEADE